MHRFFALLLLLILPFQVSWASVTVYCQHETGVQARHIGHHDHQHTAVANQGDAGVMFPNGGDSDCGTCHAGCVVVIFGKVLAASFMDTSLAFEVYRLGSSTSPHYLPERPNWVTLA